MAKHEEIVSLNASNETKTKKITDLQDKVEVLTSRIRLLEPQIECRYYFRHTPKAAIIKYTNIASEIALIVILL